MLAGDNRPVRLSYRGVNEMFQPQWHISAPSEATTLRGCKTFDSNAPSASKSARNVTAGAAHVRLKILGIIVSASRGFAPAARVCRRSRLTRVTTPWFVEV